LVPFKTRNPSNRNFIIVPNSLAKRGKPRWTFVCSSMKTPQAASVCRPPTSLASAAAKSPRTTPRDQEGESMCGNCGGSDCEWIRYGEALRDAALRLERRLTRRKRRNRSIRLSVCILYLYMKDGNMRGIVPACIRVGLLELWPEKKRVCIMLLVVLAPPH
jgi:hypothetical protein